MDLQQQILPVPDQLDRLIEDAHRRSFADASEKIADVVRVHADAAVTDPSAYPERLVGAVNAITRQRQLQPVFAKWILRPRRHDGRQIRFFRPDGRGDDPGRLLRFIGDGKIPLRRIPPLAADADRVNPDFSLSFFHPEKIEAKLCQIDGDPPNKSIRHIDCRRQEDFRPGRWLPGVEAGVGGEKIGKAHPLAPSQFHQCLIGGNGYGADFADHRGTVGAEDKRAPPLGRTRENQKKKNRKKLHPSPSCLRG